MLNNRRQSIGPRPDSRPRLKGAHYKYLTNCSCLLSPTSAFSHAHTQTHHQPDSSPPVLAQWACYKKASAYGSRVGWIPARRNNNIGQHLAKLEAKYSGTFFYMSCFIYYLDSG